MTFFEQLITEAVRLAGAGGAGMLVVLVLLLGGALLVVVGRKLGAFKVPAPDPEPAPDPPAQWNQDPSQGAVVVPGPPGGSDEQNLAG